jgi:hypothetical protein
MCDICQCVEGSTLFEWRVRRLSTTKNNQPPCQLKYCWVATNPMERCMYGDSWWFGYDWIPPSFLSSLIENRTRLAKIKNCPLIVFYFNYSPYFFIVFYFFNPFFIDFVFQFHPLAFNPILFLYQIWFSCF